MEGNWIIPSRPFPFCTTMNDGQWVTADDHIPPGSRNPVEPQVGMTKGHRRCGAYGIEGFSRGRTGLRSVVSQRVWVVVYSNPFEYVLSFGLQDRNTVTKIVSCSVGVTFHAITLLSCPICSPSLFLPLLPCALPLASRGSLYVPLLLGSSLEHEPLQVLAPLAPLVEGLRTLFRLRVRRSEELRLTSLLSPFELQSLLRLLVGG